MMTNGTLPRALKIQTTNMMTANTSTFEHGGTQKPGLAVTSDDNDVISAQLEFPAVPLMHRQSVYVCIDHTTCRFDKQQQLGKCKAVKFYGDVLVLKHTPGNEMSKTNHVEFNKRLAYMVTYSTFRNIHTCFNF